MNLHAKTIKGRGGGINWGFERGKLIGFRLVIFCTFGRRFEGFYEGENQSSLKIHHSLDH